MLGSVFVVVVTFADGKLWEKAFLVALGSVGFIAAFATVRAAWALRDPENAPILRAIRSEPHRIIWMYEHELRVNGVPTHSLFLFRDDGERYEFHCGQHDANDLVRALAPMLPHALVGYSEERAHALSRSPAAFRAEVMRMEGHSSPS